MILYMHQVNLEQLNREKHILIELIVIIALNTLESAHLKMQRSTSDYYTLRHAVNKVFDDDEKSSRKFIYKTHNDDGCARLLRRM